MTARALIVMTGLGLGVLSGPLTIEAQLDGKLPRFGLTIPPSLLARADEPFSE